MRRTRRRLPAGLSALLVVATGCVGRLVTPGGEAALGAEQAAEVESRIGLVEDGPLQSYMGEVGARLVRSSSEVRRDVDYRFRVIDLPEPNAFALPGGYVYVSRGLLCLLESEDELANVLAHEIAHVSERHHLQLALRRAPFVPVNLATGLGGAAVGLVSPLLGRGVTALGRAPGELLLARYSRGQEESADEFGQALAAGAGWDPAGMARVMESLTLDERRRGGHPEQSGYFATHPSSQERARATAARAEAFYIADPDRVAPTRRDFLARLEGLLVGASAREGVIAGDEFLQPDLDFRVAFPSGWTIVKEPDAIRAIADNQDAVALVAVASQGRDAAAAARAFVEESGLEVEQGPAPLRVGAYDAVRVVARSRGGDPAFRYLLTWLAHGDFVYQISGGAWTHAWEDRSAALDAVARSFRPLQPGDWSRIREGRLRVAVVEEVTPLSGLLPLEGAWSLLETAVANRLAPGAVLEPGALVKVAPLEPYRAGPREGDQPSP